MNALTHLLLSTMSMLLFVLPVRATESQEFKLTVVKGTVETDGASGFQKTAEGAVLKAGQTIRTSAGSTAVVKYPNGSLVKLNANSSTKLISISRIDLMRGALFAHIAKEDHPHFEVRTKTVVAGVRGTELFTSYGGGKSRDDGWLCVHEGEVEVKPEGNLEPVVVKAGFGIVFKPGQKIAPPDKFEWTEHLNWNMDSASGDVTDKTSIDSMYKDILKHNYD
jgi:ferric-dicitrate binding protein FerR (iron transport regulator)